MDGGGDLGGAVRGKSGIAAADDDDPAAILLGVGYEEYESAVVYTSRKAAGGFEDDVVSVVVMEVWLRRLLTLRLFLRGLMFHRIQSSCLGDVYEKGVENK